MSTNRKLSEMTTEELEAAAQEARAEIEKLRHEDRATSCRGRLAPPNFREQPRSRRRHPRDCVAIFSSVAEPTRLVTPQVTHGLCC
jgi:hypothetical protein